METVSTTVQRYYELLVKSSLFLVETRTKEYYTIHYSEQTRSDRVLTLDEILERPSAVTQLLLTGVDLFWDE